MVTLIVFGYIPKCLIIVASIYSFIFAKTRIPEIKSLLQNDSNLNRKMRLLVIGLPISYIAVPTLILYPHLYYVYPSIFLILFWVIGMVVGTRIILGAHIQDNSIRVGKFVTIYSKQ